MESNLGWHPHRYQPFSEHCTTKSKCMFLRRLKAMNSLSLTSTVTGKQVKSTTSKSMQMLLCFKASYITLNCWGKQASQGFFYFLVIRNCTFQRIRYWIARCLIKDILLLWYCKVALSYRWQQKNEEVLLDSGISPEQFQRLKQLLSLAKDVGTVTLTASHFLSPRKAYRQGGQDTREKELNILSWGENIHLLLHFAAYMDTPAATGWSYHWQERELLFSIQATFRGRSHHSEPGFVL